MVTSIAINIHKRNPNHGTTNQLIVNLIYVTPTITTTDYHAIIFRETQRCVTRGVIRTYTGVMSAYSCIE